MMSTTDQINAFIEKSAREFWDENAKAVLLSYLGSNIRNNFPDSEIAMGGKGLRRYLQAWPIVNVVAHPTKKEKIGVVPLDVVIPEDTASLFAEPTKPLARPRLDFTRYRQDFWNAFLTPIRTRKFVTVTGDYNFLISDTPTEASDAKSYELKHDDLVLVPQETPAPEKAKLVRGKIDGWLARYGLARQTFEEQRKAVEAATSDADIIDAFASLDPSDQARISVPLDIVIKLLRPRS